jgi:general secretion pathway protein G
VNYLRKQSSIQVGRGDTVTAVEFTGRRVTLSRSRSPRRFATRNATRGFTLIELVITITVLTIMTMGVVPLLTVSVKRQKEQQLHDALRQMRSAIDEFHRDTVGMDCSAGVTTGQQQQQQQQQGYIDPRSKVKVSDCTIFGVDNPDRYPPTLEILVEGVDVVPRAGLGDRGNINVDATKVGELTTKKKIYLRAIPIDPITGKADWCLKSNYDEAGSDCGGQENVFDVHSKSDDKALNGDKYSDW